MDTFLSIILGLRKKKEKKWKRGGDYRCEKAGSSVSHPQRDTRKEEKVFLPVLSLPTITPGTLSILS
jgi:hypothetical protein